MKQAVDAKQWSIPGEKDSKLNQWSCWEVSVVGLVVDEQDIGGGKLLSFYI